MIAVLQRVTQASVTVSKEVVGSINQGLLILLGISVDDNHEDMDWLLRKIINLRIFNDDNGVMNLSCQDIRGQYLVVSQFTLQASTRKGNRPSYIEAARPEKAEPMYLRFSELLGEATQSTIEMGKFGADMQVSLTNDGPVTIILDSKNKR